ncbi:DNA primase, partial [Vibrio parahaemolyticus]
MRKYVKSFIDKRPSPFFKWFLENLLNDRLGYDTRLRQPRKKISETRPQPHKEIKRTPMREVSALLIQNPSYAQMVPDLSSVIDLSKPGLSLFTDVRDKCQAHPHINT